MATRLRNGNAGYLAATMDRLAYFETPVTELNLPDCRQAGVRLVVKREDVNHPYVSGNKWWKLKYNLEAARAAGHRTLLTFGGAYSNHVHATSAAAHELGFRSIGIIRGEKTLPLNDTLRFATEKGMHLHYVSREAYREKQSEQFQEQLREQFGDFYLIPEGGTNDHAVRGCEELGNKLVAEVGFNYLCLAVGTAGTLSGLTRAIQDDQQVVGFSVLKGGSFLAYDVNHYAPGKTNWQLETEYHFGGYGKVNEDLKTFLLSVEEQHQLPLDPVYTAKALYGTLDLIKKGAFPRGSTVLFLHTGGMQGRRGFNF